MGADAEGRVEEFHRAVRRRGALRRGAGGAGFKVERKINLGATLVAHEAIRTGAIDIYPEYTGTGLNAVMKAQGMTDTDPRQGLRGMVKAHYEKEFKLTWLKPSGINNGYAIIVRPETAKTMNLKTLTDLAKVASKLKLGAGPEFGDRRDGLRGFKEVYGRSSASSASSRRCACATRRWPRSRSTWPTASRPTGRSRRKNSPRSKTTRGCSRPISSRRSCAWTRSPATRRSSPCSRSVGALLDNPTMQELNRQVEVDKKEPRQVAGAIPQGQGGHPLTFPARRRDSVELGERTVRIADVVAVARQGAQVSLAALVAARLERARAVVERFAAGDRAVYGLNTGLGAAVDTALDADDIAHFQRRAVMARAVGVGDAWRPTRCGPRCSCGSPGSRMAHPASRRLSPRVIAPC